MTKPKENPLVHYSILDKIKIRYELWRYIQPFIKNRLHLSNKVIQDNIYLFTLPRSGSTWLAELMLNISNSFLIDEPLWSGNMGYKSHTTRCDQVKELGFYFIQPIPQKQEWKEAEDFFESLLKIQIPKYGLFVQGDKRKLLETSTFVFKFCYGNLLLPWLIDKFHIKPIFLIRHPCAVVNSQLRMPHFNSVLRHPEFVLPDFRYNNYYQKYDHILKSIKYPEENLAAHWAIANDYLIRHSYNNKKWLTVSYENLYSNFEYEINRIFKWTKKPVPTNLSELRRKPSKSSQEYAKKPIDSNSQLSEWQKRLNQKQIDRILCIIEKFGIDYYDYSPDPNLNIIYG